MSILLLYESMHVMCMCEYYNIIMSTPLIDAHLRSCMIVMSLCKARVYRLINLYITIQDNYGNHSMHICT